jgi:hypothetical protein
MDKMANNVTEAWDSPKQKEFVEGGLKDPLTQEYKPCTAIAGIGDVSSIKLKEVGFIYAYHLVGQYMVNNMDDKATVYWLEHEILIARKELRDTIVRSLRLWCDRHQ